MITGDKPETAVAISRMCSLLRREHQVERVVGLLGEPLRRRLADLLGTVQTAREEDKKQNNVKRGNSSEGTVLNSFFSPFRSISSENSSEAVTSITPVVLRSPGPVPAELPSRAITTDQLALVVDGISLEAIWASPELISRFTDISRSIPTVIACRVSPLQKV